MQAIIESSCISGEVVDCSLISTNFHEQTPLLTPSTSDFLRA